MGKEVLAIPEEKIEEVIVVIRAGMMACENWADSYRYVSEDTINNLREWCNEHDAYRKHLREGA